MPLINSIPSKYKDGFEDLYTLTDDEFIFIEKKLAQVSLVSSTEKLANYFSSAKEVEPSIVREILLSVSSLIPFIETQEMINEIADDIVSLFNEDEEIEISLESDEEKKVLYNRLLILLNNKAVFYASKAEDLINQYGNAFILCRIISDIRPVFDVNLEEPLKAGLILHNLNIHYQSGDEPFHKDISLILTSDNIKSLKEALSRAERKEAALQSILSKGGIINLKN